MSEGNANSQYDEKGVAKHYQESGIETIVTLEIVTGKRIKIFRNLQTLIKE